MTTPEARARTILGHKVAETIGKCGGVGGAAVLVRNGGRDIIASAQGQRKSGASGAANNVAASDRWRLGSISKPVTATLIGILVQKGIGSLRWNMTVGEVFPEFFLLPVGAARKAYRDVTMDMLMSHVSGVHYDPLPPTYHDPWLPNPPQLGCTDDSIVDRRRSFSLKALTQKPLFTPGAGYEYGSGPIICAAMVEKKTGKRFERLLKEHLFEPLGMEDSSWGRTSNAELDGVWQHDWNADAHRHKPDPRCISLETNFALRGVAGFYCMSAGDMGRFLREHLRSDPQVLTTSARAGLHNTLPSEHSNITRGSWGLNGDRTAPASAGLGFDGDDGTMYASSGLYRTAGWGHASFANFNNRLGTPLVYDLMDVTRVLNDRWQELAVPPNTAVREGVHPTLGFIAGENGSRHLFIRRHSGAMTHRVFDAAGASGPVNVFQAGVFTSGVAAASSADGKRMIACGRGTDNKIWFTASNDGGASWSGFEPILAGVFRTGPAITMSGDGEDIDCFGIGLDDRMWHAYSRNGGRGWVGWAPIGNGVFTSQPAAAGSRTGNILHVFGRGRDYRVWSNRSTDDGKTWRTNWKQVPGGEVLSGPSATCLITGQNIKLFARGADRTVFATTSTDSGDSWGAWSRIADGPVSCVPAVRMNSGGNRLDAAVLGTNFQVYRSGSVDGGTTWSNWNGSGSEFYL